MRQARARFADLLSVSRSGRGVMITRHGADAAVLLPPEAAEVWASHAMNETAERYRQQAVPVGASPGSLTIDGFVAAEGVETTGRSLWWATQSLLTFNRVKVPHYTMGELLREHMPLLQDYLEDLWAANGNPAVGSKRFRESTEAQAHYQDFRSQYRLGATSYGYLAAHSNGVEVSINTVFDCACDVCQRSR
ncbi:type II toxin-antitoxin system Phd/YefM family antitoxin [Streptomyces albidoflavus]